MLARLLAGVEAARLLDQFLSFPRGLDRLWVRCHRTR